MQRRCLNLLRLIKRENTIRAKEATAQNQQQDSSWLLCGVVWCVCLDSDFREIWVINQNWKGVAAIDDSYKSLRFFERERERGDSVLVKHTGLSSAVHLWRLRMVSVSHFGNIGHGKITTPPSYSIGRTRSTYNYSTTNFS